MIAISLLVTPICSTFSALCMNSMLPLIVNQHPEWETLATTNTEAGRLRFYALVEEETTNGHFKAVFIVGLAMFSFTSFFNVIQYNIGSNSIKLDKLNNLTVPIVCSVLFITALSVFLVLLNRFPKVRGPSLRPD